MKLEQKKELNFEGAKKIIPQIELSQMEFFGDPENIKSADIELSVRNELIEPFLETNKSKQFIHYTDIQSFCEIINSKHFRMYNCDNLNDPKEIEYGLNKFGLKLSEQQIQEYKRSHFVFSSCKYNDDCSDDFNMWRLYGNNGKGIGIVFSLEFENDNYQSEGIYVGDVNYGTKNEKLNLFKEYIQFHNDFNDKQKLFNNTPKLFSLISGFFKDDIWSLEKESRIFSTCYIDELGEIDHNILSNNFNTHLKKTIETTINSSGKQVYYMKLPLKTVNQNEKKLEASNKLPKIIIEKVILGYAISQEMSNTLHEFIDFEIPKKLGYSIEREFSQLFKD